uniref:Cytochrome P450 n=1 Tax=Phanerodontia chrysosporium TaxID=2822231 RepID=G5EJS5_PHACH|nr:cytochrome P450 [Phanerodontia chrysosporium]
MGVLILCAIAVLAALLCYHHFRARRFRLPPGPKGLPVVGNVLDVPKDGPGWLTYERWSNEYDSDVIYLNLLGSSIVILNSSKATTDLLEKRSSIYSDRQRLTVLHDYVKGDRAFAFLGYGDEWRQHRGTFHKYFHGQAVHNFRPKMLEEARKVLVRLQSTDDYNRCFRVMSAASILGVTFGMDIEDINDPYVVLAEEAINYVLSAAIPGSFVVDSLPILKYLPAWAPGAGSKRKGAEWHDLVSRMILTPFETLKQKMAEGTAKPCIAAAIVQKLEESKGDDAQRETQIAQYVTGTAYTAAADTTVSSLCTFILAMVLNPEVQALAQEEIDRVIGTTSLPDYTYRDSLPYVSAIMYEVLRWRPVAPLGVPHRLIEDDEYEGYHIPGGSLVVGNIWAITHDPVRYLNPDAFDPTRWLTTDGQLGDVTDALVAFGFGRRVCPGRHYALEALWITLVHVLAAYRIEPPVDAHGRARPPSGEYLPGFIAFPAPFKAVFKPRSPVALGLIQTALG